METKNILPSRVQIGQKVNVVLFDAGTITNCEVVRVHFELDSVSYDVIVESAENPGYYTTINGVGDNFIEVIDLPTN